MELIESFIGTKELIEQYVKIEGTAIFRVTDVYPKTVVIIKIEPNVLFRLEGWIDLSELSDEMIELAEYTKLKFNGGWKRYEKLSYCGSQKNPAYHTIPLIGYYGLGVTLTMSLSPKADRHFDYLFFAQQIL